MRQVMLSEILTRLPLVDRREFADRQVVGITNDSRAVKPGYVFVAISGYENDGHKYLADAVAAGAAALIVERTDPGTKDVPQFVTSDSREALALAGAVFYGSPSEEVSVVGVTGTSGKTTTSSLLQSMLEAGGERCGLLGTVHYCVGSKVLPARMTTPDSLDITAMLRELADQEIGYCVMEVSSHALAQRRTAGVNFRGAIFTGLGRDHLDFHGTVEDYLRAKARLFEALPPEGFAVLRADDAASATLRSCTRARFLWYGVGQPCDVSAEVKAESLSGTGFVMRLGEAEIPVKTRLIGLHNVRNCLAAAAAADALDVPLEAVRKAIESFEGVPGRLERVDAGQPFSVLVDYAHKPDAMDAVMSVLRPLVRGRLLLVFGCGGDRDRGKRPLMGAVAEKWADRWWLTADNSRSENTVDIIREIEAGITSRDRYEVEPDRAVAIRKALGEAEAGDLVLISGKGHETYQILQGRVLPFDDREVALAALAEIGW